MADCFNVGLDQINPINQLILDVFGNVFAPSQSTVSQPPDKTELRQTEMLKLVLPGKIEIAPPPNPLAKTIQDFISMVIGPLSSVMAGLAPIFIILDFIRAIVDIICSLFNPIPLVAAVVKLLVEFAPPVIALFPPFAIIPIAIDIAKIVVAICVSIIAEIVPTIVVIVNNARSITKLISEGNIKAVVGVNSKICQMIQELQNQTGILSAIGFILDILDFFMSLGSAFFCFPSFSGSDDSSCCDEENCPAIFINPAGGVARVVDVRPSILGVIEPETELEVLTAVSQPNAIGLLSSVGIGHTYTVAEMNAHNDYIVNQAQQPTIKIKMTRGSLSKTVSVSSIIDGRIKVRDDTFSVGSDVNYIIVPDKDALLVSPNTKKIGLSCMDDIILGSNGLRTKINTGNKATMDAGLSGLDPLAVKLGSTFPRPPLTDLNDAITALAANPTVSQNDRINGILQDYIDKVSDFYDRVICIGANSAQSSLSADKTFAFANLDSVKLSLRIRDIGGNNLLLGGIPGTTATAQFFTTLGTISDPVLDSNAGVYTATLTTDTPGIANITAAFTVAGQSCMLPQFFDGFTFSESIVSVKFAADSGDFQKRRRDRQYVQARGSRRR